MGHNTEFVSDSRFTMWRAVVAIVHADGIVTPHEVNCILECTRDVPFSDEQRSVIDDDFASPRSVPELFRGIVSPRDREDFFHLARAVSWSDGDLDVREEVLLRQLGLEHTASIDRKDVLLAHRTFEDIYIEGRQANEDDRFGGLIRRLLNGKPTAKT